MIVAPPAPDVLPGVRAEPQADSRGWRTAGDAADGRPAWQVDMGDGPPAPSHARPLPRTPPLPNDAGLFEGRRLGAGLDRAAAPNWTRGAAGPPIPQPQVHVPRPPQPKGQRPAPTATAQEAAGGARTFGALRMHLVPADQKEVQEIAERDAGHRTPDTAATESDRLGSLQTGAASRRAQTKVLSVPGAAMAPRASGVTPPRAGMPRVPFMAADEDQPLFGMHAPKMSRAEIYGRLGVADPHPVQTPPRRPEPKERPPAPSPVSLEFSPRSLPTIDLSQEPAQRTGPAPAPLAVGGLCGRGPADPPQPVARGKPNSRKVAPAHMAAPAASRQNFVETAPAAPDKRGKCTIM